MNDLSHDARRLLTHLFHRTRRFEQLPRGELRGTLGRTQLGELRAQLNFSLPELVGALNELDRTGRLTVRTEPHIQ